uniref:Anoctamin n=1 Tax=Anopheles farauti TaxID=69004 RepID=A0A182QVL1_9DIPT
MEQQHPLLVASENIHDSGIIEDVHQESEDTGNEDYGDESNLESNLRRRKGKIISCVENASRLIRRRVPCAGHLMTPRRLWLNKIPTQCDVVIEFPEDAPDDALRWLLNRIKANPPEGLGLSAMVRAHESTKRTAFYLTAPMNVLFKAAEDARLPKRLRTDLGGALKEFTKRESHCFAQSKDNEGANSLFTSQERQWLVLQVLQGLRAGTSDLKVLQGRAQVEEGQSIVAAWQELGLITQVFPLHETTALQQLQSSWVRKFFAPQPLDDIAAYFGVKVALYFAWLGHYTCALCVPAVLGTILYAGLWGRGQTAQDIGHVIFSLFNVAWASLYLEAWRRYSVELAFRWGTLSTPPELLEPPRPLYKGPLEESSVTGRLEPKEAPAWQRRAFRYLVSFPIIGLCLVLVFVVMFLMLRLQDWWDAKLPEQGVFSCLSVIPKVLLAGAITLMDEAYYKLAVWLNDKENYRLQSKYENHLIAKVALFQFVNSFLSLFYIAFYLRDQDKLKEQLAGLLISRQIIGNLRESAWPYLMEQWRLAKLSFSMWGALSPTQELPPTLAATSSSTTSNTSLTASTTVGGAGDGKLHSDGKSPSEYSSTSTTPKRSIGQAEIESSLYKRPFGQRVANIGTWQNALGMLGLAAVIVNCALIGLSGQVSRLWPGLTSTQTVILIVALEHVMLGLRSALTWLLPELPSWLAAEIARAEHCRREMQCKGPSPRQTPPSPPSSTSISHHEQDFNSNQDIFDKTEQSVGSETTQSPRIASKPIQIPEIPPFRKQAHSTMHSPVNQSPQNPAHISSANPSPPRIAEIPPFRPRNRSKEWMPNIEVGRVKQQELATGSDSELLKPAPSWTNVAIKAVDQQQPGTSNSAPSVKAPTEEEAKAAELAAKKSRLKQSLVKRARSVAIFSLKLKEQRAKRAEKMALEALEALPAPPPGGELSLIPIEQLIQVDDVLSQRNHGSGSGHNNGHS